jgi:predicted metal-dependent hydrolase
VRGGKGREIYKETFEMAMFIVKRKEKVMRIRLSRRERGVRVNVPRNMRR